MLRRWGSSKRSLEEEATTHCDLDPQVNTARECPNRTNPKPSYTSMISNVMKRYIRTMVPTRYFCNQSIGIVNLIRPMIAIVDDDAFVRESLRDLMESLGYNVAAFESSERFLEVACLAETSCVIIDLQMPGFSGLDLQDRLTGSSPMAAISLSFSLLVSRTRSSECAR